MDASHLALRGWAEIQFGDSSESALRREMLSMSCELGKPQAVRTGEDVFTILTPASANVARPKSLSNRFSCGEFELHTDTAHWVTPCRYILLACVDSGEGGRPTLLLDTKRLPLTRDQLDLLHSAPVRITNGRRSFYSTILARGREFVRFDEGCMTGPTTTASAALQVYKKKHWLGRVEEFRWRPGVGLLIANWRILHGRGLATTEDPSRRLLRISLL